MISFIRQIAAVSAILVSSVSAMAADLEPPPPVDDLRPATFDWSGTYVGLNGGYAFGGDDRVGLLPGFGTIGSLSGSGYFGGAQLGYNMDMDGLVLGIEGDLQWADITDSDAGGGFTMSSTINYFGTVRARAGYAIDNVLVYGTAGLAYADVDYNIAGGGGSLSKTYGAWGYALGGGIEYAFDDNWSAKAEYMYLGLGNKSLTSAGETTVATPSVHTARIGVNYRF
jgi:outer membrane immunogenic protein